MASLDRNLRRDLENAVKKARRVAEAGARQSLEQLAVHHHEPWGSLTPDQRKLRNRLRAHGRQLGDKRDEKKGTQSIERLVGECAYEHWHRLLFARFLAENELLVEPDSGMPLSLEECRELAREQNVDWLGLASDFAQRMLPQIFRAGDPVLEVTLPPETRQELEEILQAQPLAVFTADDSLGWVYQFWQAEQKDAVNKSRKKVGSVELPAVTQIFTEDYMVLFLLHNTIGAWWASRVLDEQPDLRRAAADEDALRDACSLPGLRWDYLRFVQDDEGWKPAAGGFPEWPRSSKEITVLDPSMGSGHFLVFALPILAACRAVEEDIPIDEAAVAVLRDNLFGLELDPRCTQIAAFNLAFAVWRRTGHRPLPSLNLACSGLSINARKEEWLSLAEGDVRAQGAMRRLFELLQRSSVLGSLIDPARLSGQLFVADFDVARPLLEQALAREESDEYQRELAVAARGIAAAVDMLCRRFTLVPTNVPYLGRGKQAPELADFCKENHDTAKADLATCFLQRCLSFCVPGGTAAVVTPQNWLFLGGYRKLRKDLLTNSRWNLIAKLGPAAFHDMNFWAATTALATISRGAPAAGAEMSGVDVSPPRTPAEKATLIRTSPVIRQTQESQLSNPDQRIVLGEMEEQPLLSSVAAYGKGSTTGDSPHYHRCFWELPRLSESMTPWLNSPDGDDPWSGRHLILITDLDDSQLRKEKGCRIHGQEVWGKRGVAVNKMNELRSFMYAGEAFDDNVGVIAPHDASLVASIFSYCQSGEYHDDIREIDQAVKVTAATLVKVPFDAERWKLAAASEFPEGLPPPVTPLPTQWLFSGHPAESAVPLQVAVSRLLGYNWPRQTGSSFSDSSVVPDDGLTGHVDEDGIVCLAPVRGEPSAADRLRKLLAAAFADSWSVATQNALLDGVSASTLDEWLRDRFFEQHCELFNQRPFIWQIWDGDRNGFSALVNYHMLAGANGEGQRTLEKLIYAYLGDWIDRQRSDQKQGIDGADGRLAAAESLKVQLEKILHGEPPYDLFVRWKPLSAQAMGWEPDVLDGVRVNIRPFMTAQPLNARGKSSCILRTTPRLHWRKDRGQERHRPREDYPWFWSWDGSAQDFAGGPKFDGVRWNDLHYSRAAKLAARERAKAGGKS